MVLDFVDWFGIISPLIIAGAYCAVSNDFLTANQARFHLFNLIGSTLILCYLYFKPNAGAILVVILWLLIAVSALIKIKPRITY